MHSNPNTISLMMCLNDIVVDVLVSWMGTPNLFATCIGFPLAAATNSPPKAETRVHTGPQAMWQMAHIPTCPHHTHTQKIHCQQSTAHSCPHCILSVQWFYQCSSVRADLCTSQLCANTFLMSCGQWKDIELLTWGFLYPAVFTREVNFTY